MRYADDFVVLCRSPRRTAEAREVVTQKLTELGLNLSPEKTRVTSFREGFAVTLQPNEVTACVMRKNGKGEKWKRQTDMTTISSSLGIVLALRIIFAGLSSRVSPCWVPWEVSCLTS